MHVLVGGHIVNQETVVHKIHHAAPLHLLKRHLLEVQPQDVLDGRPVQREERDILGNGGGEQFARPVRVEALGQRGPHLLLRDSGGVSAVLEEKLLQLLSAYVCTYGYTYDVKCRQAAVRRPYQYQWPGARLGCEWTRGWGLP